MDEMEIEGVAAGRWGGRAVAGEVDAVGLEDVCVGDDGGL